jgi:hypothetical protein
LSLIRRNVSSLAHVEAARAAGANVPTAAQVTQDSNGREVLAVSTPIARLDWLAIVELPVEEATAFRK